MITTAGPRREQRRFVALGVLLCGLALPVTGLADHLARDTSGADARGWAVVHIVLGTLFVVFATWHAALNRRALLKHLRGAPVRPASHLGAPHPLSPPPATPSAARRTASILPIA